MLILTLVTDNKKEAVILYLINSHHDQTGCEYAQSMHVNFPIYKLYTQYHENQQCQLLWLHNLLIMILFA